MRIIKPLKLGLISAPITRGGKFFLSVGAITAFPFASPRQLHSEQDFWAAAPGVLGQVPLDMGQPKARGEVLVVGDCHPPGGQATACAVQVGLGAAKRSLAVQGDRTWLPVAGDLWRVSEAAPFSTMRVGPETAYGGPEYPANPLGVGHLAGDGVPDRQGTSPLPNVEDPAALWSQPEAPRLPAGFFPLSPMHPDRAALYGTTDLAWSEEVFPAEPLDTDPLFHNTAPAALQLPGWLHGDERFSITNMHPEQPLLQGRLPGFICRAFVSIKGGDPWREVVLMPETAWLFPGIQMGCVIHRGVTEVGTFMGTDVETLLLAYEIRGGHHRAPATYHAAMARRLDDDTAMEHMLRQDDLSPPEGVELDPDDPELALASALEGGAAGEPAPPADGLFGKAPAIRSKMMAALTPALADARQQGAVTLQRMRSVAAGLGVDLDARVAEQQRQDTAQARELLQTLAPLGFVETSPGLDAGGSPEELLALDLNPEPQVSLADPPPVRSVADVAAAQTYLRGLHARGAAMGEALEASAQQQRQTAEARGDRVQADLRDVAAELGVDYDARLAASKAEAAVPAHPGGGAASVLQAAEALGGADAAAPFAGALAQLEARRPQIDQALALAGGARSGGEMGAEVEKVLRDNAHTVPPTVDPTSEAGAAAGERAKDTLAGADLSGADLSGADLCGADLSGADLSGADLSGAVLAHADLSRADLSGAKLTGANLGKARGGSADLSGADLSGAQLDTADLSAADLSGAAFSGAMVRELKLGGADLSGANLADTSFLMCDLSGADLSGADLSDCLFMRCDQAEMDMSEANAPRVTLVEPGGAGLVMCGATLTRLCVTSGSDLTGADLSGADLAMASLRGVDLQGADLSGASLVDADMSDANLASADLSGARLCRARLRHAALPGADLSGADLANAALLGADLTGADLQGAHLFETETHYAVATGADTTGATIERCKLFAPDPEEASS